MNKAEQLIACLEGEIAKRDARIVELEEERKEYSDIMERHGKLQMTAGAIAEERNQLRSELAAIRAQEPVGFAITDDDTGKLLPHAAFFMDRAKAEKLAALTGGCSVAPLYASPVSEAKAQGVYSTDPLACSGCASGCFRCRDGAKAQGVVMLGRDAIREVFMRNGFTIKEGQADLKPYVYAAADELLRLAAAPSAPAADAWIPVSERMPEPGEPVQVWCEGAEQPGLAWVSRHADWSGEWVIPEPQAIGYESITHWMPLPAGPAAHRAKGVV